MSLRKFAILLPFAILILGCDAPQPPVANSGNKKLTGQVLTESQSQEAAKILADTKSGSSSAKVG